MCIYWWVFPTRSFYQYYQVACFPIDLKHGDDDDGDKDDDDDDDDDWFRQFLIFYLNQWWPIFN